MSPSQIVRRLIEAEGDWSPEGYRLLASATAGDYDLKLWQGSKHIQGQPTKFNELSLNRRGLSFEPVEQNKKFPGSIHALGQRRSLLSTVAGWLKQHGTLYVGSHSPEKLRLYYSLFRRYMPQLQISAPYAPFDESETETDYFRVDGPTNQTLESLLEELGDIDDPEREVGRFMDFRSNIKVLATLITRTPHEGFNFICTDFFENSHDDVLLDLARNKWFRCSSARAVAQYTAEAANDIKLRKQVRSTIRRHGIEDVIVDDNSAMHWIKFNRPHLLAQINAPQ